MPRYFAFLRAINVGGHVVKMESLRQTFEEIGLTKVETFIASGNVIFESRSSAKTLEEKIEAQLQRTLGYEVKTFVRSNGELTAIAECQPFAKAELEMAGNTLFIGFLNEQPTKKAQTELLGYPSKTDSFHFDQRELYWLCRTRVSDSEFSGARLEKTLGMGTTVRNSNTVKRLTLKYPPAR
jgi:uncharacterized protein (DUF1697 family)